MAVTHIGPGNFALVLGDDEVKRSLRKAKDGVDDWLYELTDAVAFHAADALRIEAPGNIPELVDVDHERDLQPGHFRSIAGIEPDSNQLDINRGRESSPADYPVYVDQGTGVFGERRSPITAIPGYVMGPIFYQGRSIFIRSFQGQPAQHFSQAAFDSTISWTPGAIFAAMPELERKLKT